MATPTADVFKGQQPDLGTPVFEGGFSIVGSSNVVGSSVLAIPTRAIWVGSSGNVGCFGMDGNAYTLSNISAGQYIPVRIAGVASSTATTTAANIVGLY